MIFEDILFQVIDYLLPNYDLGTFERKLYSEFLWKEDFLQAPAWQQKRALKDYLDFPEFYSQFGARVLGGLSADDEYRLNVEYETASFLIAFGTAEPPMIFADRFPLPLIEFTDSDLLAEVRYNFEFQLDHSVSVYPVDPSPAFGLYYWSFLLIVSRLLVVQYTSTVRASLLVL